MSTVSGTSTPLPVPPSADADRRAPLTRRFADALGSVVSGLRSSEEHVWRWAGRIAATIPLVALAFAVTVLAIKAWPSMKLEGIHFLTSSEWNPGGGYAQPVTTDGVSHPSGATYGAWPLILGTVQSSVIALIIAVPISIGGALALTQRLPGWISRSLGFTLELLAGIPSVIIGLWGVFTLGPILAEHVYPHIAAIMPNAPIFDWFREPTGHGEGLLTSGIILSLMIIPIIAATTRELFRQVPVLPKEGASALGMTDFEVTRRVTIPWVRAGIIGASVLGLGRAIGETIAVAMVSGSVLGHVAPNIYSPMTTIAATIVSQLDSAQTDGTGYAVSALAFAALILAVISVLVNIAARVIVAKTGRHAAPVGA